MTTRNGLPKSIEWHICSLIVTARPIHLERISREIARLPGAEVAIRDPVGKLVVTIETVADAGIGAALAEIESVHGVITAALVFHQVEEQSDEPSPCHSVKEITT